MKKNKQIKAVRAFNMLKDEKSDEEILKVCSQSTLKKVKTYYNNRIKNGQELVLNNYPEKPKSKKKFFEGRPVGVDKMDDIVEPIISIGSFINKDSLKEIKSSELRTLEDLIKYSEVDTDNYYCSNFTSGVYGSKDNPAVQCKGIFKPKVKGGLSPKEMAHEFKELVNDLRPIHKTIKYCSPDADDLNIAIIPIADLHFGARSLAQETGDEYDLEIASKELIKSIRFHIKNIKLHNVEKIILPVLGDFFNTDTVNSTTTKGTFQEETTSWKKTFRDGCSLLINVLLILQEIAPVEVYVCNGNHDEMKSFQLQCFLNAYYDNTKNYSNVNIMIDDSDTVRKYIKYGNSLFGFGHGDTKANVDYLGIMSVEAAEYQSGIKFRNMIIGHLHHKAIEEKPGITIRRVGSLNACNTWHKKKGFESLRSSDGYIVNKNNGVICNSTYFV